MAGSSARIPHYITARTLIGLRRLMLKTNLIDGKEYTYSDIQFAQNKWIAFYYKELDQREVMKLESQESDGN